METRSVLLEIPAEILERGEKLAADQHISLSDLVSQLLSEVKTDKRADDHAYHLAMLRQLALMKEGLPFGITDEVEWTRDDLHER